MADQESKGRRGFLIGLGALGAGALTTWFFRRPLIKRFLFTGDFDRNLLTTAPAENEEVCLLTSGQVEGPFYYPSPERVDLTEDREGQRLQLRFQVNRHPGCTPIEGAMVDIWHCDGDGVYSGYPEEISRDLWETMVFAIRNGEMNGDEFHVDPVNENRFLRGMQKTDAEGWVTFETIVPGWYEGRVPHIHAKIVVSTKEQLTTQFYFPEDLCNFIYTNVAPYNKHGVCPMSFEKDIVLSEGKADGLLLKTTISGRGNFNGIVTSTARIGIGQSA